MAAKRDKKGRFTSGPGVSGVQMRDMTKAYLATAESEVEKAIARGTLRVQRDAKILVSKESGPPASAPGEPPHKRTGTLGRSIDQETFKDQGDFVGRVGTNLKYGLWLELGTRRMAKRPYLRPALDMNHDQIIAELREAGRRMS